MSAASEAAAAVAAAHSRLLADRSLQFDFPLAPKPPTPPAWLTALVRMLEHGAPFLKWVMWIALGLVAALFLYFLVRELMRLGWSRKAKARPAAPPAWAPDPEKARKLLEDADALAAKGDYAGAAHALLYRSIDDLERHRQGAVKPYLTSRDIADLDALPTKAKPAFGLITQVVERSHFGGGEVGAEDFARCRDAYEAFAFGKAWA